MSSPREDRGAVAVLVAIMMTALLGLVAIVVDLGLAQDGRRRAQSAVDSTALAAATALRLGVSDPSHTNLATIELDAVRAVKAYALSNAGITDAAWTGCTDIHPLRDTPDTADTNTCISFDDTKARVILPVQASPVSFGGLFGAGPIDISAVAVAQWAMAKTATPTTCWLCVQAPLTPIGLAAQDGQVTLEAGDIQVGTSGPSTLSVTSGHVSTTGQIHYTGPTPSHGSGSYTPAPAWVPNAPAAAAPTPPLFGSISADPLGDCTAGIYAHVTGCNHFEPGTYVITGSNVFDGTNPYSGALETAAGTTFYFTCSSGLTATPCGPGNTTGGSLIWRRSADFHVNGPAAGRGAAIEVDPQNTSPQRLVDSTALSRGQFSRVTVAGGIQAPGADLTVVARNRRFGSGASTNSLLEVTGQIVVDTVSVAGIGSTLHQKGTPPSGSGSPTWVPVQIHLIS